MRRFLWIPLLCSMALAQGRVLGPKQVAGPGHAVSPGKAGGGSAPTPVQICTGNGGANPENCNNTSFGVNVTSGNCIICQMQFGSSTSTGVSDPTGGSVCNGTWTAIDTNVSIAGGNRIGSQYQTVATGTGTCNPTVAFAGGTGGMTMVCTEVHGQGAGVVDQHNIFDAGNGAFAGANSLAGTSVTDANTNDLVLGLLVLTGTPTFVAGTSPLTFTLQGSLVNVVQTETATAPTTAAQVTGSNSGGTGFGGVLTVTIHP